VRNAFIGLLIGLGLGWLVLWEREGLERVERAAQQPEAKAVHVATGDHAQLPKEQKAPDVDVRTADAAGVRRLAHAIGNSAGAVPDDTVRAAIERIAAARASRDWKLFEALLQFLAACDSPEAQVQLIELMGDMSLRFHDWRAAENFVWGLSTTELEGAVPAVRRIAPTPTSNSRAKSAPRSAAARRSGLRRTRQ